ncbi:MAG TPA: hypothetical protein PK466_06875 [Thermotogota bacterium]|nr:hypothetical protein [Thermotogota bacterium]HPJ88104.1 hypothetical protein [Thermotogota bacterium]HPR96036.1 hypothetical protein [Thermotogota bacterium]
MKKTLVLLIMIVVITGMCFSKKTVWVSWEGEEWFKATAAELEAELGEEIQVVYIPELEQKLSISLKGNGELPDLCLVKTDQVPLILKYKTPLSYAEMGINQAFNTELLASFEIDDTVWAVPYYADMQLMYLSTDIFDQLKLNIPDDSWTVEDFERLMMEIKKKKKQPSGWGINSAYIFTGFQEGLGSPIYNKEGKIQLVTPENIALIREFKQWYDTGLIFDYVNRPNIVKAFSKKQLAMFPQGSFLIQKFIDKKLSFEVRNLPYPWKSLIDPKGWVIFNGDENTRRILGRFVERNEEFATLYIKYPAVPVSENTAIPYYKVFDETMKNGMIQPIDEAYVFGYWPAISTAIDLVLKENTEIEEALTTAQRYVDNK